MAHTNRLNNTHVLVFGGTSGIGYAIANMALSNGARITISGSAQPKVDTKVSQLRSLYPDMPAENVAGFACDLFDIANLEANLTGLFDKVTQGGSKKIDHIAYTAGDSISLPGVNVVTPEALLKGFNVRLIAPSIIAKLLTTGEYMPQTVNSSFTLTGGTNTHKPFPGWTFVAAVGASAEGLIRGLAVDLNPIRTNIVIPGATQSELLQPMLDRMGEEATAKWRRENSLTDTLGQPEEIAEAYGYLMKDKFANGSQVTSDGGRLLVPAGQ
ncbi:NAD(P)-binding protein [Macroventuria anomochaeta]|uniref:NAD(P)-binding protein n=1 Tax=Macroventuria anomochaeta TaxID=301207 RepID=A0ACB6RXZ4_9PLEO|nr:NAD(P)-binding protein [Macroventuria anomochaeta]KAF2626850.1 NAD(P)-binding protein [Macroventuria anomochaeta]